MQQRSSVNKCRYNNVLRYIHADKGPEWLAHIAVWKSDHSDNIPFVTTLHVLNSAILKLSRVQPAEKVFRGNQGGVLPDQFWKPNKDNVRGGIELGFMSTTTNREIAEKYSTEKKDKSSMIFEIQMVKHDSYYKTRMYLIYLTHHRV